MRKKPELLAPAGNMEKLKMAVLYGADAVYLGGKAFGLRALGGNFSLTELKEAVDFAHSHRCRVYVTVNIFPHNSDMEKLPEYLRYLNSIHVDALLVADLGVFMMCRNLIPEMELHISTQANNTNWAAVNAWKALGAKRVVLAREMSLEEIREIRTRCDVDLEMFIHGAMCISYSGRCLLSNYFTGRDSNRGSCAQSCRWKYALVEETRPGQYFPIAEDEQGTYIMNSKDMCLMPYLRDVIESGVDSLKIEGRMKSVHYAASVVKAYRMAIDSYFEDPDHFLGWMSWKRYRIVRILPASIIIVPAKRIRYTVGLPMTKLRILLVWCGLMMRKRDGRLSSSVIISKRDRKLKYSVRPGHPIVSR